MTIYGTGNYAQTYTAEKYEIERRQRQELADLFKSLEQWQSVFRVRLEQWCRNGPSESLRAQINEAAEECGSRIEQIMGSSPPRITGPTRR
jgi:uncharacterized protein YecE (DUF72 family)